MKLYFINKHDYPINLLTFLQKENNVSKRLITKLKRAEKGITCQGKLIRTIDDVPAGAEVVLSISDSESLEPNSELEVEIVYEDDSVVVFDKPQGMPVHPSLNHYYDTLGNYFAYKYPDITFRPINRLDRNTSGLCVVAKNQHSAFKLQKSVKKVYYAIVCGCPEEIKGTIDAPIKREQESMIKRCVSMDGQNAVTHYNILSCCEKYSLAKIILETGRTHQIRVHFAHIGCPLAGDDLYGGSCEDISAHALHCGEIIFPDYNNNEICLKTQLNKNMSELMFKYKFIQV